MDELHPDSIEWFKYAHAVTLVYLEIEGIKSNDDLMRAINLVEPKSLRENLLAVLNNRTASTVSDWHSKKQIGLASFPQSLS